MPFFLPKLEETLFVDGQPFDLSANRYPGVVHPQGYRYLTNFRLDPFSIFTYEAAGIVIEKSVFMVHGEDTTVLQYEVKSAYRPPTSLRMEIRPLIAFRDYHSMTHENGALNANVEERPQLAAVTPYAGLPTLYMAHNAAQLRKTGLWYRNFEYEIERERGLDFTEDLFNPFMLRFDLLSTGSSAIIASTECRDVEKASQYRQAEIKRRRLVPQTSAADDEFAQALNAASEHYIAARGTRRPSWPVITGSAIGAATP